MLDLSNASLWIISVSVFVGGIIGSPHCLSMCGPLVLNFTQRRRHLVSYQLGRMMAYAIAGAVLGGFGESLLGQERSLWISGFTLSAIAILLVFNGYRAITNKPLHLTFPKWAHQLTGKLWSLVRLPSLPKTIAAMTAGFLTVLLPCGHLYGFLLGAAVTGSALKGATFMFAFWLGSAPLLTLSGGIFQSLFRNNFTKNGQRWAGALLIASGIFSLASFGYRLQNLSKLPEAKGATVSAPSPHHCH